MARMASGLVHIKHFGVVEMAYFTIAPGEDIGGRYLVAGRRFGEVILVVAVVGRGEQVDTGPAACRGKIGQTPDRRLGDNGILVRL